MQIESQQGLAVARPRTRTRSSDAWIGHDPSRGEVVLVIAEESLASVIAEVFHTYGFDTDSAATPLDAIRSISSLGDRIATVVISPDVPWAGELRELLAEEYPELERLMLA